MNGSKWTPDARYQTVKTDPALCDPFQRLAVHLGSQVATLRGMQEDGLWITRTIPSVDYMRVLDGLQQMHPDTSVIDLHMRCCRALLCD